MSRISGILMVTDVKHVGGICIRCKDFPGSHGCQVMLGGTEQKNLGPMHVSCGLMQDGALYITVA